MDTTGNSMIALLAILTVVQLIWLVYRHEITIKYIKQTQQNKRDEFAIVSHQLRTPLTTIRWYTEMLLNQDYGKLQIEQLEALGKVNEGVMQSIEILNTFLEKVRTDRYGSSSQSVTFDVCNTIKHVIASYESRIYEKNHTVIYEQKKCLAFADPFILHGIIDAIMSNAIHYTHKNGTINIKAEETHKDVIITVKDNGIGISSSQKNIVFSEFHRGEKARLMNPNGSGLSLHVTKKLIDEMGASINFSSEEDIGTKFYIHLRKGQSN